MDDLSAEKHLQLGEPLAWFGAPEGLQNNVFVSGASGDDAQPRRMTLVRKRAVQNTKLNSDPPEPTHNIMLKNARTFSIP